MTEKEKIEKRIEILRKELALIYFSGNHNGETSNRQKELSKLTEKLEKLKEKEN